MSYQSITSWNPSKKFLNKKCADYRCNITGTNFEIKWSFTIFKSFSPYSLIKCEMSGFGVRSQGYGEDLNLYVAFKKAFAESWERLWMFRVNKLKLEGLENITNSNGFAAGITDEEALKSSRNELIERKVFMESWGQFEFWDSVRFTNNISKLLASFFKYHRFKLKLFIVKTQIGELLIGCAQKRGLYFDAILIENKDVKKGERKLVGSLMRAFWKDEIFSNDDSISLEELRHSNDMSDHIRFYLNPENHKVLLDIENQVFSNNILLLDNIDAITSRVISSVSNFPAVAYSMNLNWENISWGKDYLLNRELKWPHPLD